MVRYVRLRLKARRTLTMCNEFHILLPHSSDEAAAGSKHVYITHPECTKQSEVRIEG